MARFPLLLSLMGAIAIRRNGLREKLHLTGQTRQLFSYLAAHANQEKQREGILEAIWSDAYNSRAISALNTAVWRIKKLLSNYEGLSLTNVDSMIRLTVEPPAKVDVSLLETVISEAATLDAKSPLLNQQLKQEMTEAVRECHGEFLYGCSEHWVYPLRERFGSMYIRALNFLMHDEAARNNYECALDYGREILSIDPFREATQREVMLLYAMNGQRARAVKQFDELKALLNEELGLEPTADTCELLEHITAPGYPSPPNIRVWDPHALWNSD